MSLPNSSLYAPSLTPRSTPKLQAWAGTHILHSSPVPSCQPNLIPPKAPTFRPQLTFISCLLPQHSLPISDTLPPKEVHMPISHHKKHNMKDQGSILSLKSTSPIEPLVQENYLHEPWTQNLIITNIKALKEHKDTRKENEYLSDS